MFELLPIGIAFIFGFLSFLIGLPPFVGYILAGFLLNDLWEEGRHSLTIFSEFGITILLFSIGLKLKLSDLLKKEIFGSAIFHFFISFFFFFFVFLIPLWSLDRTTAALIALSLTFSSTVYVIKLLEERGDIRSHYGRISIGILIIQDIIAVIFIAASANQLPSLWVLILIAGIWPIRVTVLKLISWVRHDELMVLLGIVLALGGAFLFDQVNIKGDLGALVFGYLLSSHPRATELSKTLMSFKDFFLLGFFLSIGMHGAPDLNQIGIAALICMALPIRSLLYYYLFNKTGLRSRTSFFGAASLFNFSEFGLIVMAISVSLGWISPYWITVLALTIAFSYLLASILNRSISKIYPKIRSKLKLYEHKNVHPLETEILIKDVDTLVIGMGRVGKAAFNIFSQDPQLKPIGFDYSPDVVETFKGTDFEVLLGDATSADFWSRINLNTMNIKLVVLAMPTAIQNIKACQYLRSRDYKGIISSIAKYPDEIEQLEQAGVNRAFYIFAEAGVGFGESSRQLLKSLNT